MLTGGTVLKLSENTYRSRTVGRYVLRIIAAVLSLTVVISSASVGSLAANDSSEVIVTLGHPITDDDFLQTDGKKIVNRKGQEVSLRGVNLGAWLIQEEWMCPVENSVDNITTFEVLTERFGVEKAYELLNTYADNWITEVDLDNIASMGFNCVRVPFWYRNFYYDDKGTKILDENGEWDFSRLDWVVEECGKRGIYVILDLHGAPGYQNNKEHCGKINSCGLFKLTKQAEAWRKLTIELWVAVAERYSGNPAVAMYDLLNEPMCDVASYIEKNNLKTISLYSRLYDAVRSVDNDHIITMEGIWRLYNLPAPWLMGWSNVVYQLHFYNKTNFGFKLLLFTALLYPYNVPLYVGEFKSLGSATWDAILGTMNKWNYSWTIWSYKGTGWGAETSEWYLYGGKTDVITNADVRNDSYEEIALKWGKVLRTDESFVSTGNFENNIKPYVNN